MGRGFLVFLVCFLFFVFFSFGWLVQPGEVEGGLGLFDWELGLGFRRWWVSAGVCECCFCTFVGYYKLLLDYLFLFLLCGEESVGPLTGTIFAFFFFLL